MRAAAALLAAALTASAVAAAPPAPVRASCTVLGDSIALGVGTAAPGCLTLARGGITSGGWYDRYPAPISAEVAIISLGTNDSAGDTLGALRAVRTRVTAGRVVWLRPPVTRRSVLEAVDLVAAEHGDRVHDIRAEARLGDGIHPTTEGYRTIAQEVLHAAR